MGLFDTLSPGQGLFSPDLQKAAALQGLVGMGSAIGAASQPSPTPGVNPFATAGIGGIRAYDEFLRNALGMSLLGGQIQDQQTARDERKAVTAGYQGLGNMLTPQAGADGQTAPLDPRAIGQFLVKSGVPQLVQMGLPMLSKTDETVTVAPGASLYDKRTNKTLFTAPEKPPEGMYTDQNGRWTFDPQYLQGRTQLAQAGRPQITVDNRQQNAEAAGYGGDLVKEYAGIRARAESAMDSRAIINIAKNIDVKTGGAQNFAQPITAFAKSLGVGDDAIKAIGLNPPQNGEAFIGTMENLVLSKMQSQSGPQTESDTKRIKATVAQLGNTNEAKDFLLKSAAALADRDIERRTFYDTYRNSKPEGRKTFDGAGEAWRKHVQSTPLVGTNPKSGIPVFYEEFKEGMKRANPGASDDAILKVWRDKYGSAR